MQASLLSLVSEVSKIHVSLSPATPELWCVVCLESSVFNAGISPSIHFCNHNFKHQPTFLLPFLVARHQDYCLVSAAGRLCDTPLLMLQSNSDQAEKHLSLHIIFFLIECTGVYLDRIWRRMGRKGITLWSEWHKSCFLQTQLLNAETVQYRAYCWGPCLMKYMAHTLENLLM